jgi:hypothetical protein
MDEETKQMVAKAERDVSRIFGSPNWKNFCPGDISTPLVPPTSLGHEVRAMHVVLGCCPGLSLDFPTAPEVAALIQSAREASSEIE